MAGDYSDSNHILTWSAHVRTQGGRILFNGASADPITVADSDQWQLTADFTLELFGVIFNANNAVEGLIGHYNASGGQRGWFLRYRGESSPKCFLFAVNATGSAANVVLESAPFEPVISTPYNITVERASGTLRFYVDGTMLSSHSDSTSTFNSSSPLVIGRGSKTDPSLDGSIQAIRLTNGTARYASDDGYIVPTLPLPTQGVA